MKYFTAILLMTVGYGQQIKRAQPHLTMAERPQIGVGVPAQNPPPKPLRELIPRSPQVVPNPELYSTERLGVFNEVHDYQIKELQKKVDTLDTAKTYAIGASAAATTGIMVIIALLLWLRKLIVRQLIEEAVPPAPPRIVP